MTTLSADQLRERLASHDPDCRILVTPLIESGGRLAAGTLDVRLGRHFIAFRKSRSLGVNPFEPEAPEDDADELEIRVRRTVDRIFVPLYERFVLHPYQLVLACTLEFVGLPPDVGAFVLSRSSIGRLGILSATATYVHPRYHGVVTLELLNTGEAAVALTPGMRIAQLVFEDARPSEGKPGRYHLSTRPEIARLAGDTELRALRRRPTGV